MKIRGNTVTTPLKRANLAQTDPKKSDYVENNPFANITEEDEGSFLGISGGKPRFGKILSDGSMASADNFVPNMSVMDRMMFEKFGTGEKDYFFSQANWDDLQRYNRAYVQAYDDENDLRLGEDGKGLYALRAICRYGAGTAPRYPWLKKSDWVASWRNENPGAELSDEEIITSYPPTDKDFGDMATLTERQPNGFIKVPTGFPTDKTEAQMEGYVVPKKYADNIKNIALAAVPKLPVDDSNRYAYTTTKNTNGESLISLIKMGANPTPDVNQPLIRRRGNGAVGTLKIPQADDDASSKYYVDRLFNGANKAVAYKNYSAMTKDINALAADVYKVGQNIMIETLDVPDLWVSEVYSTSIQRTYGTDDALVHDLKSNGFVQIGYYKLSPLETQKVDLTDYAVKREIENGDIVAHNATYADYATYASTDTSKGTIEGRLGELEELTGENGEVKKATVATYASEDTSKGTIEERLTALGFREGSVTLDYTPQKTTVNSVKRQGNFAILTLDCQFSTTKGAPAISYGNSTVKIGTVPEEFRPKEELAIYGYRQGVIGSTTLYTSGDHCDFILKTTGVLWIKLANGNAYETKHYITTVRIRDIGYEVAPITNESTE